MKSSKRKENYTLRLDPDLRAEIVGLLSSPHDLGKWIRKSMELRLEGEVLGRPNMGLDAKYSLADLALLSELHG